MKIGKNSNNSNKGQKSEIYEGLTGMNKIILDPKTTNNGNYSEIWEKAKQPVYKLDPWIFAH